MSSALRRKLIFLFCSAYFWSAAGICCAANASTDTRAKITGIYSDLSMSSEDVVGVEIFIVLAKDGYFGVVQFGEGTPTTPVVVPITVSGNQIKFSIVMPTGLTGKFHGKISKKGLTGKFEGEGETFTLLRKKSLWQ